MKLYTLFDKVSGHYSHFMLAENDGVYVRELIAHRIAFPLNFRDCIPMCLGNFDATGAVPVHWDSWKSPETTAELLAPLGLSQSETVRIAREKIERQIQDLRSKNAPVPKELEDELNLYVKSEVR